MRRSVDVPRSMPDRVWDASQRLEDLARAQGRGAPALRSSGGSVLEVVDTSSAPTLVHADAGVGARFQNGTLQVVDADGVSARDLSARNVAVAKVNATTTTTDTIVANDQANLNLLYANGITCYFALTADTVKTNGATVNGRLVSGQHEMGGSALFCGDIHQEGFGLFTGGIISTGNIQAPTFNGNPSSRALKRDIRPFDRSALDAVRGAPIQRWRYREDAFPGVDSETEHAGPMVDDLPEDAVAPSEHGPAPEFWAMLRYAWQAVRELADLVDAQGKRIAELEARLP